MTQEQKILKNKVGLLKLAQTLVNLSEACKLWALAVTVSPPQGAARDGWRGGLGGDFAAQAESEVPNRSDH